MSLNSSEINLILAELSLDGAFIQDVAQPGFDTLALFTYKAGAGAKTVTICLASGECRICATERKISRAEKSLRFMEFLRARVRGARIDSCAQIRDDRIALMALSRGDEKFSMYIRLWSGAANVVLCAADGKILDAMYRRPVRGEVTGGVFVLPEPREGVARKERAARDFAELPNSSGLSFNQKVDLWYGEKAPSLSREAILEKARKWHDGAQKHLSDALDRLERKRSDFSRADSLRRQGDLILSNINLFDRSRDFIDCDDFETGEKVRVKIDPRKSARENAVEYYERCRKEKSGAERLAHEIALEKSKMAALDALYEEIKNEDDCARMERLFRRASEPRQRKKKASPGLEYEVDGWRILVGRDAGENDELLRRYARGNDLWLHARDCPGGYVFVKAMKGKEPTAEVMACAATLAVYHSKARKAGAADLYCAPVKYLRRAKGAPKGSVIPTREKNIYARIDQERLDRMEASRANFL